jgi:hypothetical protein
MRRRARKRDFRGGSISDFFNKIDVKRASDGERGKKLAKLAFRGVSRS